MAKANKAAAPAPTTEGNGGQRKKRVCPVTHEEFLKAARPLSVTINGVPMAASVKEFSSGSFGWYLTGKTTVDVGGTPTDIQIGANFIVVGSKDLAKA